MQQIITLSEAELFIFSKYAIRLPLTEMRSSNHSVAFQYTFERQEHVLRFNATDFGFQKDRYASLHYSRFVPVPSVLEIGSYKNIFFCISEKLSGRTVRDEYLDKNFHSLSSQFDLIEIISRIQIPHKHTVGEWDPLSLEAPFESLGNLVSALLETETYFSWEKLAEHEDFDVSFFDSLKKKMQILIPVSEGRRELRHGDFGNDNVLIENEKIQGILDWQKAAYDDHFFDIGRVVLYNPNRSHVAKTALAYYANTKHENFRQRIMLGVYITMLINYGAAARANMGESLRSSPERIRAIEKYFT